MNWFDDCGAFVKENAQLLDYNHWRIPATARWLACPRDLAEMKQVYLLALREKIPVRILGGGANVLMPDGLIRGLVINTSEVSDIEADPPYIRAQAGASLPGLVATAARYGLSGLECLAGVPGTLGGALMMNAGGKHGEIGPLPREIHVLDEKGESKTLFPGDFKFQYRSSNLGNHFILSAVLKLRPENRLEVKDLTAKIMAEKRDSQPLAESTVGCTFKNPSAGPAGRIIDQAGLKGARRGAAVVSQHHANFILNEGNATAKDVRELIRYIQQEVKGKTGIDLEPEVKIWEPD